jgi:hypothetical protein
MSDAGADGRGGDDRDDDAAPEPAGDLAAAHAAGEPIVVPPRPAPPTVIGVIASVEPPSPDVEPAPASSRIPGAVREGYHQLPTAPVITAVQGPSEDGAESPLADWQPAPRRRRTAVGAWALGLAIAALAASLLVGWMLPLGLVAVVLAIVSLRRRGESRAVAVWALVLGAASIVYSAGWLYAAARTLGVL